MRRAIVASAMLIVSVFSSAGAASAESLLARVDVATQTMQVIRHGRVLYTWRVSTARRGYITPAGSWRPKRMHRMWYSRKYDMSPMPYAIFYNGGYAVHGTNAVRHLGRPASHGCVRLDTANAAKLYSLVEAVGPGNTRIEIVR